MTGLVLKLGPRERIMINGAVMENGDRRTRLNVITPDAHVLRMKDAIHPDEVKTPVTRVCYIAQLVLAGVITRDARVLRLRDAIHPEDVTTPVTRVCYVAQMVLAGEAEPEEAQAQLRRGIEQLGFVFCDAESVRQLQTAAEAVEALRFYPALKALRSLLPREKMLLDRADGSA